MNFRLVGLLAGTLCAFLVVLFAFWVDGDVEPTLELMEWEQSFAWPGGTAVPIHEIRSRAEIHVPDRLRENQTQNIFFTVRHERSAFLQDDVEPELLSLDRDVRIELISSGFDIAPSTERWLPEGTVSPVQIWWTVSPRGEGHHDLILDLSDMIEYVHERWSTRRAVELRVTLGNREVQEAGPGVYVLPVRVRTYLWLPAWMVKLLEVVGLLILGGHFVLLWNWYRDRVRQPGGGNDG